MGLFITLEGIEGSGKSTQVKMLVEYIKGRNRQVKAIREPGDTTLGERVRAILLQRPETDSGTFDISPLTELFLYEACRAQLVKEVITPALKSGAIVICDRYTDSTLAYQGYARSLDLTTVKEANDMASGGLQPDLTILIDLDPKLGLKRATARMSSGAGVKEDRFEAEHIGFHERVRAGFLSIAGAEPERVKVVDGAGKILSVHQSICAIIVKVMFSG